MSARGAASLALLAMLAVWPAPGRAAEAVTRPRPSPWLMDIGVGALNPLGPFRHDALASAVVDLGLELALGTSRRWSARLGVSTAEYGSVVDRYDLPGIRVDVRTSNLVTVATLGPQLNVSRGRWSGLAHAGAGTTWFATQTAVEGGWAGSQNNFTSACFAVEAGGAVRYRITRPDRRVLLEAGGRWVRNDAAHYVPAGGADTSGPELRLTTVHGDADLVEWRVGVAMSPEVFHRPH